MSILSNLFSAGQGLFQAAGSFGMANDLSHAANMQKSINAFKDEQTARKVYMGLGAGEAAIGASGLQVSGSAADVMRANAEQGALERGLTHMQGAMEYNSLKSQEESANIAGIGQVAGAFASFFG